mmetsp:Transcript_23748/g.60004  ORF Transcript_23748/g.60004 Transcript_23748/m.60004 type:complete len:238 (+) Transcript_23748:1731-2444(+)
MGGIEVTGGVRRTRKVWGGHEPGGKQLDDENVSEGAGQTEDRRTRTGVRGQQRRGTAGTGTVHGKHLRRDAFDPRGVDDEDPEGVLAWRGGVSGNPRRAGIRYHRYAHPHRPRPRGPPLAPHRPHRRREGGAVQEGRGPVYGFDEGPPAGLAGGEGAGRADRVGHDRILLREQGHRPAVGPQDRDQRANLAGAEYEPRLRGPARPQTRRHLDAGRASSGREEGRRFVRGDGRRVGRV